MTTATVATNNAENTAVFTFTENSEFQIVQVPPTQYWIDVNVHPGDAPCVYRRTTGSTTTNIIQFSDTFTTPTGGIAIGNGATISVGTGFVVYNSCSSPIIWTNTDNFIETEESRRRRKAYDRERAQRIHRAKGAIKRGLKMVDNMGFGDDVRVFIGGNAIEVSHPDSIFKFVLQRKSRSDLVELSAYPGYSTPYKLSLYTKTDVHVTDLCVYLKDTPVIDQVLAVALYIKTGSEEDVLEKANWFNITRNPEVLEQVARENILYAKKLNLSRSMFLPADVINANIRESMAVYTR